jgi:hypothetical protein
MIEIIKAIQQLSANILRLRQDRGELINPELIEKTIRNAEASLSDNDSIIDDEQLVKISRTLSMQFSMDLSEVGITLANPGVQRGWLKSIDDEDRLQFNYYNAFKEFLTSQGRPIKVINENERIIDDILDLSGDPLTDGRWSRRGLVMGNVQSGKTQNYTALVNKAADLGYKTIIILGGHQKMLRKQTQQRIDEGLIGKDNLFGTGRKLGVGEFRDLSAYGTHEGTGERDFNTGTARVFNFNLRGTISPIVFVVKKNVTILKKLNEWILQKHDLAPERGIRLDLPLLLIDDEADYASPNSKQASDDVTATNEVIRNLLDLFKKNTYVGYTATPFANIFIDPENDDEMGSQNLFPKDFMIKVPVPENYCGQDFFYSDNYIDEGIMSPLRPLSEEDIEEHEEKLLPIAGQKKWMADTIEELPEKLKEAVRAFLISTAVRFIRGDKSEHHTMIINISHLSAIQNKVSEVIGYYLNDLKSVIEATEGLGAERAKENSIIKELYKTFDTVYEIPEDWDTVYVELQKVARKIKQYSINVASPDILDYNAYSETGLVAIVMGGHKLSRGMTLEGLSVSYFARNSKMYDTLMQMCRWFGYRDNYQDLCKVYMPEDSIDWYQHISRAINELYVDLEEMAIRNKTPENFGLKVRSHPDSLMITSRLKMHTADDRIHSINLWGQRQRRFRWTNDEDKNKERVNITEKFLNYIKKDDASTVKTYSNDNPSMIYSNVRHRDVIQYIEDMQMIPDDTGDRALISHIKEMSENLPDNKFKVVLRTLKETSKTWFLEELDKKNIEYNKEYELAGNKIILPQRLVTIRAGEIKRPGAELGEAIDESFLLDQTEVTRIRRNISVMNQKNGENKIASNKNFLRSPMRDFPGLIIYPFNLITMSPFETKKQRDQVKYDLKSLGNFPHIGFVVTFPIEDPELYNMTPGELRQVVKRSQFSVALNRVGQKQIEMWGYPEDEEEDD